MVTEPNVNIGSYSTEIPGSYSAEIPKTEVKYFGSVREAVGQACEYVDGAPITLPGLLYMLSVTHGAGLGDQLFDENGAGGLRDDLMVTVNESIVNHENVADIVINPGDVVSLFPIFPGGG